MWVDFNYLFAFDAIADKIGPSIEWQGIRMQQQRKWLQISKMTFYFQSYGFGLRKIFKNQLSRLSYGLVQSQFENDI